MNRHYIAEDYAGLETSHNRFYYGYEYDEKAQDDVEQWGFSHNGPDLVTRMSYKYARETYPQCPDRFSVEDCLLWFIGLMIEQGNVHG